MSSFHKFKTCKFLICIGHHDQMRAGRPVGDRDRENPTSCDYIFGVSRKQVRRFSK
jgi:hypothetical protein